MPNAKDEQPFIWLLDPFVGAMSFILIAPLNGIVSVCLGSFVLSFALAQTPFFFGVCMSLEVHRFVSVFMFSLFSFCAQAKPMRDEPVCLCVCFAQTFYLFYLCLSICALTTIRRPAHCLRQRPASPAHEPAIAETKRRILCVGVEAIVRHFCFLYPVDLYFSLYPLKWQE